MRVLIRLILPVFALSSTVYADVRTAEVGRVSYGEVVRTIFSEQYKVCYTISHGSKGVKIACVKVKSIPAGLKRSSSVAEISYGKLFSIVDSDLGVTCIATSHGSAGVDINCSAN